LRKKTTNWKPVWSNPTQESSKGDKAFAGANEKTALGVPNNT